MTRANCATTFPALFQFDWIFSHIFMINFHIVIYLETGQQQSAAQITTTINKNNNNTNNNNKTLLLSAVFPELARTHTQTRKKHKTFGTEIKDKLEKSLRYK